MKIRIVFETPRSGEISVRYGTLLSAGSFADALETTVECGEKNLLPGEKSTIVTAGNFSFFLRDVNSAFPVFVPNIGAAALPEKDLRSYAEVALAASSNGDLSDFELLENAPEESLENAEKFTRDRVAPTWLGVGPDIRGFWLDYNDMRQPKWHDLDALDYKTWGYVRPATHMHGVPPDPEATEPYFINFLLGGGPHCAPAIERSLEDGFLPILHSTQHEGVIDYDLTAFVTLEGHTLSAETVQGTPNDLAYAFNGYPGQCRLTAEEVFRRRKSLDRSEELVLMMKVRARNLSKAPAYAFFSAGTAHYLDYADNHRASVAMKYTLKDGFCSLDDYAGKCVVVNRLNGHPMKDEEMSVLVMPGEEAVFEMLIPSGPVSAERAAALAGLDYETHYRACRAYWLSILDRAAKVELPEKELEKRVKAGLIHLLLATTGESTGPLMADVGMPYSPIGSESAPMILAYDWLGMTDVAGRCIEYFFDRQNEQGAIRTYSNYENETGPLLWTAGEHFLHTRDTEWLKRNLAALKKSCEFLLSWRNANKTEECRLGGCYGLQKGKVDDPDDFYHSFYLNAGSYAGLHSLSEALKEVDPEYAEFLQKESAEYRADIIKAIHIARAKSPAIPLRDGTWIQHLPPWTEYTGDPAYHADGGVWTDHGTIFYRVQTNPPLYCGIFGVLDCRSEEMTAMLLADQSPHTIRNASYCQPYYVRNDYAFAIRGEVKPFLATFYNQLAAIQDRETYTFFEHYYSVPFKGHEEGWMLMQIRWMLFLEDGNELVFCGCAPRNWFKPGEKIALENVLSKFGRLSLRVTSSDSTIVCEFSAERAPEAIRVRLPHPAGRKAVGCEGGVYDPATETVRASGKSGKVTLFF